MFKSKNIYSLKERIIADMKLSPAWGWYFIGIIWFIIITMILSATPSKALSEPMAGWEDYTSEISQLHFGDKLKAQIYSLDNEWKIYDIDKLAYAVAMAETGNCTKGYGKTRNNCFGIMSWPNGRRTAKWYDSPEDSYNDFKRIWSEYYGSFPDYQMAKKWTGNDHPAIWLANVTEIYNPQPYDQPQMP